MQYTWVFHSIFNMSYSWLHELLPPNMHDEGRNNNEQESGEERGAQIPIMGMVMIRTVMGMMISSGFFFCILAYGPLCNPSAIMQLLEHVNISLEFCLELSCYLLYGRLVVSISLLHLVKFVFCHTCCLLLFRWWCTISPPVPLLWNHNHILWGRMWLASFLPHSSPQNISQRWYVRWYHGWYIRWYHGWYVCCYHRWYVRRYCRCPVLSINYTIDNTVSLLPSSMPSDIPSFSQLYKNHFLCTLQRKGRRKLLFL